MTKLTPRQFDVLKFIADAPRIPTIQETMAHFGWTGVQGVLDHWDALERKGYLVREKRKARTLQLTGKAWELLFRRANEAGVTEP